MGARANRDGKRYLIIRYDYGIFHVGLRGSGEALDGDRNGGVVEKHKRGCSCEDIQRVRVRRLTRAQLIALARAPN